MSDDIAIPFSNSFIRLANMYTTWNLIFLCIWMIVPTIPEFTKDMIRANTFIIAAAVSYFWLSGNNWKIYQITYDTWIPPKNLKNLKQLLSHYKQQFLCVCDIITHFVPVYIIGLPQFPISILISYLAIFSWYVFTNKYIDSIYVKLPSDLGVSYNNLIYVWLSSCSLLKIVTLL